MGLTDGYVLGVEKIVDHGPDLARYNIALLSEGYTAGEMPKWEADAQMFVNILFGKPPFSDVDLQAAINVHRVDVVSNESGADNPVCEGPGDGSTAATYFDATFCGDGRIHRLLTVEELTVLMTQLAFVPFAHLTMVIVNTSIRGGSGGLVGVSSTDPDWVFMVVHELGHAAFGLADEYDSYRGCESGETDHDRYPASIEPDEPNVTVVANREFIKWGSLIDSSTSIPTTTNDDCTKCDDRDESPELDGTVGAFEGARYYHCDAYRPEFNCLMREQDEPFCAVCSGVIRDTLAPFAQPTTVTLQSATVALPDVEEGVTVPGAVTLAVDSWLDLSFWVADWPHRTDGGPEDFAGAPILDLPYGRTAESAGPGARTAYAWITYQATSPGDSLAGTVTVECNETGQSFTVPITANTVERRTVGVMLSLDKSSSMLEPASGGGSKGEALQDGAGIFVDIMLDDDGVGVNSFATDAYYGTSLAVAGGVFGPGRSDVREYIREDYEPVPAGDPAGLTSIGDAIEESDARLAGSFDEFAMVVFTDGMETAPKYISEVAGLISSNPRIFAVGLGTPENLDPAVLATLCSGSGGELLLTGGDEGDTFMLLAKYFLNILAGVTNTEIVRDPEGYLAPGAAPIRIDFELNETDTSADVVLVTPVPSAARFALETPARDVILPTTVVPGTTHVRGARNAYYRVSLPALVNGQPARDGTWYALLSLDMDDWTAGDNAPLLYWYLQHHPSAAINGLHYSLHVQARSNLKLVATCLQDSYEPGAELRVRGILTEYGLPIDGRATVRADLTRPDGTAATLPMPEIQAGVFETLEIAHQTGVYQFRVLASGVTLRNTAFTREQLVTGFTYHGGDNPPAPGQDTYDKQNWCQLLKCLIDALTPEACDRLGIDCDRLRRCVRQLCSDDRLTTSTAPANIDPSDIDPADLELIRTLAAKLGMKPD
jgi:hypothetical protein